MNSSAYSSEILLLTKLNHKRLLRNKKNMLRQICHVKPEEVATVRPKLENFVLLLRGKGLTYCWFGHVECVVVQLGEHVIYRVMEDVD